MMRRMRISDVRYPQVDSFSVMERLTELQRYLQLSAEFGRSCEGVAIFNDFLTKMDESKAAFNNLVTQITDPDEPETLEGVRALRPDGPRRLSNKLQHDYADRLRGAFYGRLAGCTLGAALEFQTMEQMRSWAQTIGDAFPPVDYWSRVMDASSTHYIVGKHGDLTRDHMDAAPPDDDIMYTLLGLLTLEEYGLDFTPDDLSSAWLRYLPCEDDDVSKGLGRRGCWWGERIMLGNLLSGINLPAAGQINNPHIQALPDGLARIPTVMLHRAGRRKQRNLLSRMHRPTTDATACMDRCLWRRSYRRRLSSTIQWTLYESL
jgi:hypothetical protein